MNGASVSAMMRSLGTSDAARATSGAFWNVTTPVKEIQAPKSRTARASSGVPVKQWKTN